MTAVAPATFGRYGGDLVAPDEKTGRIVAIDPGGHTVTVVESHLPAGSDIGVESAAFVPPGLDQTNAAYLADPLVHRAASAGFVRAIRAAQAAAMEGAPRLAVPLLILHGDADRLVLPAGSAEIAARLSCPHQLVLLPGFYHELLNEPASERARVLEVLDRWFDRWLAL